MPPAQNKDNAPTAQWQDDQNTNVTAFQHQGTTTAAETTHGPRCAEKSVYTKLAYHRSNQPDHDIHLPSGWAAYCHCADGADGDTQGGDIWRYA
eukprot:6119094-Pyramimonas_sp.AAC.1